MLNNVQFPTDVKRMWAESPDGVKIPGPIEFKYRGDPLGEDDASRFIHIVSSCDVKHSVHDTYGTVLAKFTSTLSVQSERTALAMTRPSLSERWMALFRGYSSRHIYSRYSDAAIVVSRTCEFCACLLGYRYGLVDITRYDVLDQLRNKCTSCEYCNGILPARMKTG